MVRLEEINYKDFLKIPNLITVARILGSIIILILACLNYKIYLIKWIFVGGIISDKLDGALARLLKQKTKLGLILEQLADTFLVLFTSLFIYYKLDFPNVTFYAYLVILLMGFIPCIIVYYKYNNLFAEKLIVAEISIIFIYATDFIYLFALPYRVYIAYFTLFLGVISLIDYLTRLYKFNRNLKNNERSIKQGV